MWTLTTPGGAWPLEEGSGSDSPSALVSGRLDCSLVDPKQAHCPCDTGSTWPAVVLTRNEHEDNLLVIPGPRQLPLRPAPCPALTPADLSLSFSPARTPAPPPHCGRGSDGPVGPNWALVGGQAGSDKVKLPSARAPVSGTQVWFTAGIMWPVHVARLGRGHFRDRAFWSPAEYKV